VPLPVPEVVTKHQDALLTQVHEVLELTVNKVVPAAEVTFWFEGVTVSDGDAAAWVTVTFTGLAPFTLTVIVATRCVVAVFSE
jgi:hypothetical protein